MDGSASKGRRGTLAIALVAATGVVVAPGLVLAHGGAPHGAAGRAGARREQQAWGIAGDPARATRTIAVRMLDTMRFVPARIDVRLGETVRFDVRNGGRVLHEFVLGTRADNAAHAELMKRFPDMEHDEPHMAHVPPGGRGTIVWTFNRPGTFEFACLVAGHYDAGMAGTIVVAGRAVPERRR